MSGYREHSYDPNAYERPGPPMRPFNWVQWTGVAIGSVGILLVVLHLLGRIGWIPQWVDDPSPVAFVLPMIGVVLVNSRRAEAYDPAPELAPARKRWTIILIAISVALIGAAIAIDFSGA